MFNIVNILQIIFIGVWVICGNSTYEFPHMNVESNMWNDTAE